MGMIILTWNPNKWHWKQYEDFTKSQISLPIFERWSCRTKNIKVGDRFIMLLQGSAYPIRGIIGCGVVTKGTHQALHWDNNKSRKGEMTRYIEVRIDKIINLNKELPLDKNYLLSRYPKQHWTPQMSGISVIYEYQMDIFNEFMSYDGQTTNLKRYISSKVEVTFNYGEVSSDKTEKTADEELNDSTEGDFELDFSEFM